MQQLDEAYITVRRHIYRNPERVNFAAVVEETGVAEEMLSYLIDQGRIVLGGDAGGGATCRACGAKTAGGILCERCRRRLISEKLLSGALEADGEQPEAGRWKAKPLHTQKD